MGQLYPRPRQQQHNMMTRASALKVDMTAAIMMVCLFDEDEGDEVRVLDD